MTVCLLVNDYCYLIDLKNEWMETFRNADSDIIGIQHKAQDNNPFMQQADCSLRA